jgi:osmotically inducible protein OsmC
MPVRNASAVWEGKLTDGKGRMKLGSGAWEGGYSFATRFEEAPGSNPDELIGAALAGCFSMALSLNLEQAGAKPEKVETSAKVHVDKVGEGFAITGIDLRTSVAAQGLDSGTFQEIAEATKKGCPVSRALTGTEIRLEASLSA